MGTGRLRGRFQSTHSPKLVSFSHREVGTDVGSIVVQESMPIANSFSLVGRQREIPAPELVAMSGKGFGYNPGFNTCLRRTRRAASMDFMASKSIQRSRAAALPCDPTPFDKLFQAVLQGASRQRELDFRSDASHGDTVSVTTNDGLDPSQFVLQHGNSHCAICAIIARLSEPRKPIGALHPISRNIFCAIWAVRRLQALSNA